MDYQASYQGYLTRIEAVLQQLCEQFLPESSEVCRAARYSLLSGGKRVRAVLVLATCDLLGGDAKAAEWFAGAIEMVHCYSLIHDDLPCMDNDDFRRGKPSCHKAFSEATALLAGDALLTAAFQIIANAPASAEMIARAVKELSTAAGANGMILGQELDLYHETVPASAGQLLQIHRNKTGALINAAVQLGAASALTEVRTCDLLRQYAYDVGLVFQIVDDVLDVTSTTDELGKPVGSDEENNKTTFVRLYGVEGAVQHAQTINQRACSALQQNFGEKSAFLEEFAARLLVRKN